MKYPVKERFYDDVIWHLVRVSIVGCVHYRDTVTSHDGSKDGKFIPANILDCNKYLQRDDYV